MNNMNKNNTLKRYKIANEKIESVEENINYARLIVQFGLLALICVLTFLIAKYIVRSKIDGENPPIDTSERL